MTVSAHVPGARAGVEGGAEVTLLISLGKCDGGGRGVREGRDMESGIGSGEWITPRSNLEAEDGVSGASGVNGVVG